MNFGSLVQNINAVHETLQAQAAHAVNLALTDEWRRTGVTGQQYATLTDIITYEWSGMTTRQYKNYKGLKKENLRDHMTRTDSWHTFISHSPRITSSKAKAPVNSWRRWKTPTLI